MKPLCICEICKVEFTPKVGSRGKACSAGCGQQLAAILRIKINEDKLQSKQSTYIKHCPQCNSLIPYSKRQNKYCNSSCAASYNNTHSSPDRKRGPNKHIKEKQPKVAPKVYKTVGRPKSKIHKPSKIKSNNIDGPYSKLYNVTCNHCGVKILSQNIRKYCKEHENLYKSRRTIYAFSFNVYHYPDLFDTSLIDLHGWYSPGNRGPNNPNGISRDHKVSVTEAIKNNYDPYYISHPMNCELMRHLDNKSKYTNSSISYNELKILVDNYNMAMKVGF